MMTGVLQVVEVLARFQLLAYSTYVNSLRRLFLRPAFFTVSSQHSYVRQRHEEECFRLYGRVARRSACMRSRDGIRSCILQRLPDGLPGVDQKSLLSLSWMYTYRPVDPPE